MKKHLMIATGLAVLSTSAFATKARLQALGQNTKASFYLDDSRSVFLNPAKLNDMNNYVVTEWGTSNDAGDTDSNPHAEGGFFRKGGAVNYGLYFGNESGSDNTDTTRANFYKKDNAIDLFVAGDMGAKWGARLQYSNNENKTSTITKEQSGMELGLGIITGKVEAYANLEIKDESKAGAAAADTWEADLGMNLGAAYSMNNMKFYADYDKNGYESVISSAKTEYSLTTISLGAANVQKVSKTSNVIVDVRYVKTDAETKTAAGTATSETGTLPITVGFEAEAKSWLTLRASVMQNVVLNDSENKTAAGVKTEKTIDNTTTVAAGATLNYGKLQIEGTVSADADTASSSGATRVGVIYNF